MNQQKQRAARTAEPPRQEELEEALFPLIGKATIARIESVGGSNSSKPQRGLWRRKLPHMRHS